MYSSYFVVSVITDVRHVHWPFVSSFITLNMRGVDLWRQKHTRLNRAAILRFQLSKTSNYCRVSTVFVYVLFFLFFGCFFACLLVSLSLYLLWGVYRLVMRQGDRCQTFGRHPKSFVTYSTIFSRANRNIFFSYRWFNGLVPFFRLKKFTSFNRVIATIYLCVP